MLRQTVLSLILAFLLFIATFSFVLRAVEFLTVRDQIFTIADFYQSIGFLIGEHEFDDVNIGADFLENNPYIEFTDRRRVAEGILQDISNAAIADPHGLIFMARRGETLFGEVQTEIHPEIHDAFFYGVLVDKIERVGGGWHLVFNVDEVLVGYPEHVVAGQSRVRMNFEMEERNEFAIDGLEIGERYFLRGMLDGTASPCNTADGNFWIPTVGDSRDIFLMQPLSPDGLWYIHISHEEMVDFSMPELEGISEEVEFLRHNHHAVQLRTTRDMMLMPIMLEEAEMGFMIEGRPIEKDDYLTANPVAVIHYQFARIRDLNIGDSITVKIPQIHHVEHKHLSEIQRSGIGAEMTGRQSFSDARVESVSQDEELYEIELEIVGIYNLFGRLGGDGLTTLSTHIYIPDSILPDDVAITSDRWGSPADQNYLPSTWYSFMLESSRYEVSFIAENRQPLEEMGFSLIIIGSAQNFWESADVILQSIAFNAIVFCIVLILVLILVVFLFLRQRRKEFTINRLLGYSIKRSVREVLATAALFLVPIAIGAIFAWLFARYTIVNTLLIFEELHEGYESVFLLSPLWLIGLIVLVFILVMIIVLIGTIRMIRRPVLELLQSK